MLFSVMPKLIVYLIPNTSKEGKKKRTADNIQSILDKQILDNLRTSMKLCSCIDHTCQIQFSSIWVNKV